MKIIKRTFAATNYPKGSYERMKLNEHATTSEYNDYLDGYWDAIQFSYMKDRTAQELAAWILGYKDGRSKTEQKKSIDEFERLMEKGHN